MKRTNNDCDLSGIAPDLPRDVVKAAAEIYFDRHHSIGLHSAPGKGIEVLARAIHTEKCKKIEKLEKEIEELRAGYMALVQFVEANQLAQDLDIDWKKFPKRTLSMAHEEILQLRNLLKEKQIK